MDRPLPAHTLAQYEWKNIQVLRMVAALMVVIFHATERSSRYSLPGGGAGVDVFFAISGFVMVVSTQELRKKTDAPRTFMIRRLLRILPLYWAVTLVALGLFYLHGGSNAKAMRLAYIAGSFLLIPVWRTLPPGDAGWHPVVNPGWTLSFEMLFYLLFALTIRSRRQVLWLALTLGTLVLVGFQVHPGHGWALLNLFTPRLLEFLGGVLVAHAVLRGCVLNVWLAALTAGAFLLTVFCLPLFPVQWGYSVAGLFGTLLVYAAASVERYCSLLAPNWAIFLGNCSYSIYLSHTLVLMVLTLALHPLHLGSPAAEIPVTLGEIAISIVLGCLLSVCVEFPMHRELLKRLNVPRTYRPRGQTA
jgi:peptidoglycan/LPS O-acetylase OafA/YrhL